jgi:NAD(P)-dependent dehydrogenase (short-subunit alcohol dehydrogenase family)
VRVKDKVAIVTGAAQGIGQEYAAALGREGAKVVLADLNGEAAEQNAASIVQSGGEAIGVTVDVSDADAVDTMVQRTVEQFGGVDVLVNNAAIYAGYVHYTLMDIPLDYWNRFVDVNLTSVLLCTKAVVPHMIERGKGKIINQSSAGGNIAGNQYGITKLGVQGLTVGFARELGKNFINVNCIAPGVINTQATLDHYPGEQTDAVVARLHLIPRVGTPEDLAHALIYLASDESDFVTGQIFHIDAGSISWPI